MTLHRTILTIIVFLCILTAPYVYATDILNQIHPYISVKGEYSDNLNLTNENQKKDFYTTISPGVKFSNMDAQSWDSVPPAPELTSRMAFPRS